MRRNMYKHTTTVLHTHIHLYQTRRLMPSIIKCFSVFPFYWIVKFSFFFQNLHDVILDEKTRSITQWIKENG